MAADATRCAEVHVASWKAGYDGLLPGEYLAGLSVEDRLPWWRATLAAPSEARDLSILVVEDDAGTIRGFGSTRAASHRRPAVVAQLYLEPTAWGTGAADALMTGLLAALRREGVDTATLRVARANSRARRFYERGGWTLREGSDAMESIWGVEVATVEYRRHLGRAEDGRWRA